MKVVQRLDETLWRDFVQTHPNGHIFHTPEMYQIFAQTKGHQPLLWATVNANNYPLALLLPVQVTLLDGPLRRLTTRTVVYGSVLYAAGSEGHTALQLLLNRYNEQTAHQTLFTELRNSADMSEAHPVISRCGFTYEEHLNYLIDLDKPSQELFQNISKSGRKAIRRSKKRDIVPQELQERSQLPQYYDLLQQTYARAEVPLADISLFEAVFDILVPKGMAKMLIAHAEDNYAAVSLEIPYKDVIYSWYSGYDHTFRNLYPNDALVWHILKWGSENGYRCFDFGGAGHPDEPYGARDFKAKFGGRLVNFGRYTRVHAPLLLKMSRIGYEVYRKLLRYLPG